MKINYAIEILLEQKALLHSEMEFAEGEERTETERRLIDTCNALNKLNKEPIAKDLTKEEGEDKEDCAICGTLFTGNCSICRPETA